jgi:archaellum component FlaF (FlaF/FlaG flagellin family)
MRHLSAFLALISLLIFSPAFARAATLPDAGSSTVGVDKTALKADGIENARVTVTLKDLNLLPLEGITVTLTSSRGTQDEIIPEHATTDLLGKARFIVRSLKDGTATYTARASNVTVQRTVNVTYSGGLSINLAVGDLIKIPDDGNVQTLNDTAVYYYASNGKRYVFPNEKVYFTWYPDFSRVKIIPIDQMSLIPIGGNVTYHPGAKLVKFQTDPKTYLVTKGGVLRWAKSEEVARCWFGAQWNQSVDDITEAFYVNYTFGQPVESCLDLALDIVRASASTIDIDRGLAPKFP